MLALLVLAGAVLASPAPTPTAMPTPFVTPAPQATVSARPGRVTWSNQLTSNGAGAAASGPGVTPPEAAGFIAGTPLAPESPYDFLTSVPTSNGIGASMQLRGTADYDGGSFDLSLDYGFEALSGSANTIGYWNEGFFPALDPHFSGDRLALPVAFPTHAGQDNTSGIAAALEALHVSSARGDGSADVGWIQPAQTLRFVFAPPPATVAVLGVMPALPETLGPGSPTLSDWNPLDPALALHGVQVQRGLGPANLAYVNAPLPSLPGTATRMQSLSLLEDRGGGNQFGAQIVHAGIGGAPISAGVLYGSNAQLDPNAQGYLPTSTLNGQMQTIVGVHQALHKGDDFVAIDVARSWYGATPVTHPNGNSGGFYHLGYARSLRAGTLQLDAYRFEPRYAQMVLPYGTPENIWSVAWSWPGVWLKSTYQLVDNSVVGINRQGLRVKWSGSSGALTYSIAASRYREIDPETVANAQNEGFVDGFFLPELGESTVGTQSLLAGYIVWHTPFADLSADLVDDAFHRPASIAKDYVAYDVPQYVLSASRTMGAGAVVAVGIARYGLHGSWASFSPNVDVAQRQLFAGFQLRLAGGNELLVQARRLLTAGAGATPGFSADSNANVLVVEERASF